MSITLYMIGLIEDQRRTRDDIVMPYANAILDYKSRREGGVPHEISVAIMRRWSPHALKYIKRRAWRLVDAWMAGRSQ